MKPSTHVSLIRLSALASREQAPAAANASGSRPFPEAHDARFAYRDETQRLIAEWQPPRELDDPVVEAEAVAFLGSPVAKIVPFACWLLIRGYEGGW